MADILYSWDRQDYTVNNSQENEPYKPFSERRIKIKAFIIKFLITFLVIVLLAEICFYAIVLPYTSKAEIQVSGCFDLSLPDIKRIAGLNNHTKWLTVNSSVVSKKLISCPLIAYASVEKRFPDKVIINVVERYAVAIAFGEIAGETVPMEIDRHGVVFRIGARNLQSHLPIITGLTFKNPKAGMKINEKLSPLFLQLDLLQKKQPILLNEISEIKIQLKRYGGYDLIIYPVKLKLEIITNKFLTEDYLRYMMLIVDVVKTTDLDNEILSIDLRGSNAVYKKRGM